GVTDRDPATDCGTGQPTAAAKLQDRDIGSPAVADNINGVRLAVADGEHADIGSARDHVVIGQHDTARIDHDAGSGPDRVVVAEFGADVDHLRPYLADDG